MLKYHTSKKLQALIMKDDLYQALHWVKDTTNSYKYLFCLSLLDILRRHHFQPTSPIPFFDLIVEMLANAWFPHSYTPSPTCAATSPSA